MFTRLREMIRQRRCREKLYATAEYWDGKAAAYSETSVSMWPNPVLNVHYDAEAKALLQTLLGESANLHILDLGCGTGRFSRWFAARGARVTGTDFSRNALAIAQQQTTGENPAYRYGSVFHIEDKSEYDVVFTWGVLTIACRSKEQLLQALGEIRQALKPGGRLLLTEPVHRGLLHRVLDMSLPEFLAVVAESGFCVQKTIPLHFWPMRLCLAYIAWPGWLTTPLYHLGQNLMRLPGLSGLGDYSIIVARAVENEAGSVPPPPSQIRGVSQKTNKI